MVTRPRGASSLGCLMTLLIIVVVVYFGINIGEAYWRYYQYRDDMRQYVAYAAHYTDAQISAGLSAQADSLGLPDEAHQVRIQRGDRAIIVEADYDEFVELPMVVHDFHFHPLAEGPL